MYSNVRHASICTYSTTDFQKLSHNLSSEIFGMHQYTHFSKRDFRREEGTVCHHGKDLEWKALKEESEELRSVRLQNFGTLLKKC